MQECTKCHVVKDESEFFFRDKEHTHLHRMCKACMRKKHSEFYRTHKQRWVDDYPRNAIAKRKRRTKIKRLVLEHYGGVPPKCVCCGESIYQFLTIDHVNNDGAKHRKELKLGRKSGWWLYIYLVKNDFPDDGYELQVLCWNCNCGKRMNGGVCPHKE